MESPLNVQLKKEWDTKLHEFNMYISALRERVASVASLVSKLQELHKDYDLLLKDVAITARDDLLKEYAKDYFTNVLCVLDKVIFLQSGRIMRSYYEPLQKFVSMSKHNFYNSDYAPAKAKVKLSALSKDGFCYESKKFLAEFKKACDKFKIQVRFFDMRFIGLF